MINRGLLAALACTIVLAAAGDAYAIDRDCPKGQVWDPNQGSCVKKKKVERRSPAKKYYEALAHIEGTARRPRPERGVKLLEDACKSKHAPSCTLLGFLHLNGRVVTLNAITSLQYYDQACKLDDPQGCLGAADIHSRGLLGKIEHAKAIPFLDAACKLKSGKGCYELAEKYQNALGTSANTGRASGLYRTAFGLLQTDCATQAGPSCHLLGMSHFYGRGTKMDRGDSFKAFLRGCAAGSGPACYWVGVSYRWGHGTGKDPGKALEFFERACQQYDNADGCHDAGVVIAQGAPASSRTAAENKELMEYGARACTLDKRTCDLYGYLYATGKGGETNQTLATKYYLIGCEYGSSAACQSAAHRAYNGNGMEKDTDRALAMWQQACDLNWAEACADLGEHYWKGEITKKNARKAYDLFYIGCVRGDNDGCHWLGWMKHKGNTPGGKVDAQGAIHYYKKACDAGLNGACLDLGHLYKDGVAGVEKNPDEAKSWYDRSCSEGNSKGCVTLGEMHFRGDGVPKDPLKAADAYARACKLGASTQCYWIDSLLREGRGNKIQRKNALKDLDEACNKHKNEDACIEVARLYAWGGYIGQKDGRRAFELYQASCKRGVKMGCVQLGHMYSNGIGVVKDAGKARELFTQQCNGDVPAACTWLGMSLYDDKKFDEAAPLFRRACDADDMVACNMIGFSHYYAQGTEWNIGETKKAYEKGCELGNAVSCANLAELYEHGIGVDKDLDKAFELHSKGCTPTDASGCENLGRFHEHGIATDKDLKLAETEYERSCEEAEWGKACLSLALLYEKTGQESPSKIAALKERAKNLIIKTAETNPYGKYLLGLLYRDGVTLVKDSGKAVELFVTACEAYEPLACVEGGTMLLGKSGVDANYEKAAIQFDRACAAGLEEACKQAKQARAWHANPPETAKPKDPEVPLKVQKKSGCACDGTGSGGPGALLVGAALLLAVRRRRTA